MKRTILFTLALLSLLLCLPGFLYSQEVASLTGVVTDKTGAVIPDVTVKLVDTRTNAAFETKTNSVGAYTFSRVLPGPGYKLSFTKDGFDTSEVANIYLAVDATHTQNVELEVGKVSQVVEVNVQGAAVSLDTTDTSVSTNFDMHMVQELPIQVRDSPAVLMTLEPGVTSGTVSDSNTSRYGAVTGARTDQSNVTLDGMDVNDFGTGEAFATNGDAPVDSVQEFRGESANPFAAEGRGSGAQIELTTKSGTNVWHGSAYEYNRNTDLEANTFFNNFNGLPRTQLIRNQFGASLGGPVVKNKLFFFFNFQGRRDATQTSAEHIVPLDTFRNGEVGYINSNPGCTASSRAATAPDCITYIPQSSTTAGATTLASLDPQGVGANSALLSFINSRYPHANDLSVGDGINTGGFLFNAPVHRIGNDYVARVDYNLNNSMKLFGRFSILRSSYGDDINYSAPFQFPGDPITHSIVDHTYSYVFGHTWTINNNMVNQFVYGETRTQLGFPTSFNPVGSTYYQNFGILSSPYSDPASQSRVVPVPTFKDDFTWTRGKHTLQFGGIFKPIMDDNNTVQDFNNTTVGIGGNLSSLNSSLRPSDILQDPGAVANTLWDNSYTFALGRFAEVQSIVNNGANLQPQPAGTPAIRNYRYYETEAYAQDTWRISSSLTMTYGLRYQFYTVPYVTNGTEAVPSLDFNESFNPRQQGALIGDPTTPIITYGLGGKANHAAGYYNPDYKDLGPRLSFAYNPSASNGFWGHLLGERKTVIRGGGAIIFDHPATSALAFYQNDLNFLFQNAASTLYPLNQPPTGTALANYALAVDPRFSGVGTLPSSLVQPTPVTVPYAPYVVGGVPEGLAQGGYTYNFDRNLKTPYSETISFGIQRELPGNFMFETTYFGRFGRRLFGQADAGQLTNFIDPTSGQSLSAAFGAMTQAVRAGNNPAAQPFFENQIGAGGTQFVVDNLTTYVAKGDIGDAMDLLGAFGYLAPGVGLNPQFILNIYMTNKSFSNYNGLLTSLHKKISHGLQFDFNYTYSHSIDNLSVPGNNFSGQGANFSGGLVCDAANPKLCRANSEFDMTHLISGDAVYDLPVGRGRALGSNIPGVLNQIIGGWQLAGIATWHTGFAFTTVTEAYLYSDNNNIPAIFNGDKSALKTHIHNDNGQIQLFADPAAAIGAFSGPVGLQVGSRNNLRGPRYMNVDLSLNKHFPIKDRLGLEFRAEAYNVFNHPNFDLPGGGTGTADIENPGQFGVISATGDPRQMQLSLRLDF
jgi:hypothetical protein